MKSFTSVVNKVIDNSDIILEIIDARFIKETRNKDIELRIKKRNKILIHVINKCDFVNKGYLNKFKNSLENCVFVSAKEHLGMSLLREKIKILASQNNLKKPIVGVIGYPNVGKSSLINSLKGSKSAKTSSEAGFTKGQQFLKIRNEFLMIDTPGVISKEKTTERDLVLVGAKNPSMIQDPDLAVIKLLTKNPGKLEKHYDVNLKNDKEATIEDIAIKLNLKKKGDEPDIERASRKILQDWVKGKI
tara:strand:- start:3877 stop:4614 length:738 start_codon:yes stop_codon:yes gene_type:complete